MKTTKTPSTPASKSTKLTDAPETQVSTLNSDFIMKSDNSTNPNPEVNSDNAVNSTTTVNAVANENLFGNEQTATETTTVVDATAITEPPKQQRIGKQQRKSDFAEFKATFLTPAKVVNRHPVNIEDDIWEQLERIARILGERGTTVASYINAVLADHLRAYSPDIEIWRKL